MKYLQTSLHLKQRGKNASKTQKFTCEHFSYPQKRIFHKIMHDACNWNALKIAMLNDHECLITVTVCTVSNTHPAVQKDQHLG